MAHPQHNFTSNFNGSDGHNAELTLNINGVEKKYTPAGNDQTYNVPGVARIDINLDGADLVQAIQTALDGAAQPLLVERSIYDEEVVYQYIGDIDGAWYFGICTTNKIITVAVAKEDGALNGEQIPVANGVVIVESDGLNIYSRLRTAIALGQLPVLSYVGANPVYAQYEKTADNGDLIFVGALATASDTYVQYNIYTVSDNNTVTVTTRAASAGGGGTPDDENGFFNTSLYSTPGDGVTESLMLDDFRIKNGTSIHGSNIEFVPTHQEGGIDFGEVYLNPGTYILSIRYTLQWVGNPRGTFTPLVCRVGGQPFDFSFEQENTVITSQIRVVTARQKVAIAFPFDADTPPMGILVETLSIAQIASNTHPAVVHDTTLTGSGTALSPLGVTTDVFGKIKDISTSIGQFRTGDVIPVDGPNGPAKIDKDDLTSEVSKKYFAKIPVTYTANKYIAFSNGNELSLNGSSASDYIDIEFASVVNINKAITSSPADARGAAFYNFGKVYIGGYQYISDTPNININVPPGAKYIRFTATTSELASTELCKVDVFSTIDKTNRDISSVVDSLVSVELGAFIDSKYIAFSNGNELSLNGSSASDYIEISNASKLRLIAMGEHVADARGAAFYDETKQYLGGYQYAGGGDVNVELSVPPNAKYIRFTTATAYKSITRLYLNDLYGSFKRMNNVLSGASINVLATFSNIVCIGDSLTWSQVYTSANSQRQAYRTYPQVLGKLCRTDSITTLARPGDTVIANWNRYKNDIGAQTNALAIIYLGTNYGLTDTLSEDAPENTDPSAWADTNTGDYAKWVSKLQSLGYKVLLIKPFTTSNDTLNTTKSVIDQIGARFGCAVLESFYSGDYKYHFYPDLSGLNGVHYNDLGYAWFASALINRVSMLSTDQMKLIIPV